MLKYLFCLFCFVSLFSEETSTLILPKGQTVEGNYFVRGKSAEISGTVNGDLYVLGGQVFVDGIVNGNVLLAGGTANLSGPIKGNIRLAAGQAMIGGQVGGSVTALAGTVEVLPTAEIAGSFVALAGNVELSGAIQSQVFVGTSNMRIAGPIRGDVTAYVNHLRVTSKAAIEGQLEYFSNTKAVIDSQTKILGGVIHHPSFFYSLARGKVFKSLKLGTKLLPFFMNFLYTLCLGLILMRYFPHNIKRALAALKKSPLHSFLTGIVILILLPLISLLFLMSILGAPFAITLIAVNVFAFYTAKIFTIMWLLDLTLKKRYHKFQKLYFALGLIVYFTLTAIPVAGEILAVAAMLFGLGAIVRGKLIQKQVK